MSLVKKSNDLFPRFSDVFDEFLTKNWLNQDGLNFSNTNSTLPSINIKETTDSFEVEMAAPGMKKKDFKIEIENNRLLISSERKDEVAHQDGERYARREFSYQSFQRAFTLPKEVVDEDKIKAKYEDGILYLTIPKKEEAKPKPPKMIEIA